MQRKLRYQQVLKSDAQFYLPEWGISNSHAAGIVLNHLRDYPEELASERVCSGDLDIESSVPMQKGNLDGITRVRVVVGNESDQR